MTFDPFALVQAQFDRVADMLDLDGATRDLLREPLHEHRFSLPVRMDDGAARIFTAWRVVHNDARGPSKGGVRFHPAGNAGVVRAAAMLAAWKSAVADLPLGGGSGGVACDPHDLSASEQERLCRAWVRALARDLGADIDVTEPDLMTNPQHMAWMLDEFEAIARRRTPASFTGKPVGMGGSRGRLESTGYGVVFVVREALRDLGIAPDKATLSLQGFGAVARHAAELFAEMGGRVVCVSTWDQSAGRAVAFRRDDGVDVGELVRLTDSFGGIDLERARAAGYELLAGETWIEQPVDVLIPAALENQLTGENVGSVHPAVKVVAEGADGPTTAAAEAALLERGVVVIPDLLAGCGAVVSGYFEQVQSAANFYWQRDEVLARLDVAMATAFGGVRDLARKRKLSLRDASQVIAVSRVATACKARGWV